jgi:hypothetical protein
VSALPQASATDEPGDNLYSMALFASMAEMEKSWGKIDNGDNTTKRTDYHHMVVVRNDALTDGLPSQFDDYQVEYFTPEQLTNRYKSLHKRFAVLEIHPMHSEGPRLKINVSVSYFTYRESKQMFAFSDWSDVEFRFDCEQQRYVISAVHLGGI